MPIVLFRAKAVSNFRGSCATENGLMNFVERLVGISPDGGSGAYEVLLLVGVIALIVVACCGLRGRRRATST